MNRQRTKGSHSVGSDNDVLNTFLQLPDCNIINLKESNEIKKNSKVIVFSYFKNNLNKQLFTNFMKKTRYPSLLARLWYQFEGEECKCNFVLQEKSK